MILVSDKAVPSFERCVSSIFSQSVTDYELIVIDDSFPDLGYEATIGALQFPPGKVRYFRNSEKRGLTWSLNQAINLSTGDYIVRIDADDECLPKRLEVQGAHLDQNTEISVSSALALSYRGDLVQTLGVPCDRLSLKMLSKNNPIVHSSVVFRRSALFQSGLYNNVFVKKQDYELWCRMVRHGLAIQTLDEHLVICDRRQTQSFRTDFYGLFVRIYCGIRYGNFIEFFCRGIVVFCRRQISKVLKI